MMALACGHLERETDGIALCPIPRGVEPRALPSRLSAVRASVSAIFKGFSHKEMTTVKAKKAEKKQPAVSWLEFDEAVEIASTRLQAHDNQITALEEAICPRVAARLTGLEKAVANVQSELKALRIWGSNVTESLVQLNGKDKKEAAPDPSATTATTPPCPITRTECLKVAERAVEKAGLGSFYSLPKGLQNAFIKESANLIELVGSVRGR